MGRIISINGRTALRAWNQTTKRWVNPIQSMLFPTHDRVDVMVGIGVKDKYGQEVFEGDVVNFKFLEDMETSFTSTGEIKFEFLMYVIETENKGTYPVNRTASIEVIGNIYEG